MTSILITEGDERLRRGVKYLLGRHGFEVIEIPEKARAFRLLRRQKPDLLIIGCCLGEAEDSLKTIHYIRKRDRHIPLVLITRHSSESRVIRAFRAGITDYFTAPLAADDFVDRIRKILSDDPGKDSPVDNIVFPDFNPPKDMIGESPPMRGVKAYLSKVASTDSTVLITGETGTGKELAAKYIHVQGPRHRKPFVCVNCASLPDTLVESELFGYSKGAFTGAVANMPGKFELANGGSIFLDEIGEMSMYTQAKILRSVEMKEVQPLGAKSSTALDIRVIAATNLEPEELISEGKFREDLYYRLNVARVDMLPLRQRREDIPELIAHGIKMFNRKFKRNVQGLKKDVLQLLMRYNWPGNVRELMNVLEGAFINLPEGHIDYVDLPTHLKQKLTKHQHAPSDERKRILTALMETNWNKSTAAAKLNWSRMTLYRKITKYRIVENRKSAR
ncbi:hypothetical protein D3OALGA1CA_5792 [Olavius algarvensis associated proteobacterium Delta 3]|nr:hypothetical protein D3OALGA1CA_5792 [Olavius algarvensis associated proteobacterium Delta 3]